MTDKNMTKGLRDVLKTDEMSEVQQQDFFERSGDVILSSALNRLLADLDDEEIVKLQSYLEAQSEDKDPVEHMLQTYPQFEAIITEEAAALRSEAEAVFLDK